MSIAFQKMLCTIKPHHKRTPSSGSKKRHREKVISPGENVNWTQLFSCVRVLPKVFVRPDLVKITSNFCMDGANNVLLEAIFKVLLH